MNRLIIIGNGFDLAHGLKTSYSHFINDYWKKTIQKLQNEVNKNVTTYLYTFETEDIKIENVPGNHYNAGNWVIADTYENLIENLKAQKLELIFKNEFLKIITNKYKEQNWVDIEIEYYSLLKDTFKKHDCIYGIEKLNEDFKRIKEALESYLAEEEEFFIQNSDKYLNYRRLKYNIGYKIYAPFKLKDFTETAINRRAQEEYKKYIIDTNGLKSDTITNDELSEESKNLISKLGREANERELRKILINDGAHNYFDLIPNEILFLNFNYTFTEKIYANHSEFDSFIPGKRISKQYIHIHGTTDKFDNNNVIFGFGDEIDDDYKSIENLNNNIYLENIKSIKYLETDNYKRLLEFLNSEEYQIYIFGHSCGISDRTLLNTLFEHKNCSSIKPFYHKKEDGFDNYSDIVKNISRNFNIKPIMRDKVVNKEYCEPLS